MKKRLFTLLGLSFIVVTVLFAQEEKKSEYSPDFSSIKDVLKNDNLDSVLKEKQEKEKKRKLRMQRYEYRKYTFPEEGDFWNFLSEFWLVKNAPALKWDFEKPDYGLESYFKQFMEELGYFEVKYKILLLDTPNVTHFALPSGKNEFLAVLSVPFIRTLNLSKLEISLILFEDFIRIQEGYFVSFVSNDTLKKMFGKNFKKEGIKTEVVTQLMKKYDELVFDKGFNFQQQFKVTKKVSLLLKNQMKLWNTYYKLIGKIDELVSRNILYKNYVKIYPSPELQLGWLNSKK